jgi:hypothetical protein
MVIAYTETKYPSGRPRKDVEYPKETYYQVDPRLFAPNEQQRQRWLERENSFVLESKSCN